MVSSCSSVRLPLGLSLASASLRYFNVLGSIHDVESFQDSVGEPHLSQLLFSAQWAHLSLVLLWVAGSLFHIGWTGSFTVWLSNPCSVIPVAHSVFDPHLGSGAVECLPACSGLYNCLATVGVALTSELLLSSLAVVVVALLVLVLSALQVVFLGSALQWLAHSSQSQHYSCCGVGGVRLWLTHVPAPHLNYSAYSLHTISALRLSIHIGTLAGLLSLLWLCACPEASSEKANKARTTPELRLRPLAHNTAAHHGCWPSSGKAKKDKMRSPAQQAH